jgi:hypothetical protein
MESCELIDKAAFVDERQLRTALTKLVAESIS